jgi:hypothetical protein
MSARVRSVRGSCAPSQKSIVIARFPAEDDSESAELLVASHELPERIRAAKLAGEEEENT